MEMINEPFTLLMLFFALISGFILGLIFYGGLWWTVQKGIATQSSVRSSAIWFMGSMILRIGITLTGFYLISAGHWERLLMCFIGFISIRLSVCRIIRGGSSCV